MENSKLTNLVNYEKKKSEPVPKSLLCRALDLLIRELGLTDGSFKVYVRQGKASPRVEIQSDISKEIEA